MNTPNGTLFGFYRALVVSAEDPEKQGRVRVRIPDIMVDKGWGTGQWCDNGIWARPGNNWIGGRNIYDTKGPRCNHQDAWYQGSCMIPPKGSHVFVFFEKGDPSHPFYFAAADYGQTKVLPENRVGAQWWNKWTPIKTRQGRTFVISDDPSDARVELTGKKRAIHNTPDGDTESVFNIDGNQSVILIDERPSHEKIFIKDYRGNYIKMIQDEAGRNDQLHVYFKDDIHIETLKNIYLQAHQNIHITANQSIYITALQNMHIKVTQEFREMAHLINRYSETNDNRLAEVDINDNANNTCARNAVNIVRDMAGSMCSRASSGKIADGAGGAMSIMAGGVMSVLGSGGTFVDGPTVAIENGSAPIPPSTGIKPATMAKKATLPKPDDSRHFTPSDDGWNPSVGDENPQYQCHNKFWKPHYKWSPTSQCDNSTVTIGGGGASSPYTPPKESEGSPNVTSTNNSNNSNSSPTNNNTSNTNPVSISKKIDSVLDENKDHVNKSTTEIIDITTSITDDIKNNIINSTKNTADKIKDDLKDINDTLNDLTKQSVKNEIINTTSNCSDCKVDKITLQVSSVNEMNVDISDILSDMYAIIKDKIDKATDVETVKNIIIEAINDFSEELISTTINDIKEDVNNNIQKICQEVENTLGKYDELTEECLQELKDKFSVDIIDQINDNAEDVLKTAELDYTSKYDDLAPNINKMYDTFKDEYVDNIDLGLDVFDKTKDEIEETISNDIDGYLNDNTQKIIDGSINDFIDNELIDIIEDAFNDPSHDIADSVFDKIEDKLNDTINDVKKSVNNDFIKPIIDSGVHDIDDTLDPIIDPIERINDIYQNEIIKPLNKLTEDNLIDSILDSDSSDPMDNINIPDVHNDDLPGLPEQIQQTIINSLPNPQEILDFVLDDTTVDDYVDNIIDAVQSIDNIMDQLKNPIDGVLNNVIPNLQDIVDTHDQYVDYSDLCNFETDDYDKDFENYIFRNLGGLTDKISDRISKELDDDIKHVIEIPNTPILDDSDKTTNTFINNVSYNVVKGFLNEKFVIESLNNNINENINNYFDGKDITDLGKCNELINNFLKDISKFDLSDKLKENLEYDPTEDLDNLIDDKLHDLENDLNECKTGDETIPNEIVDTIQDIIKPLTNLPEYKDFIKNDLDDHLDKNLSDRFNPLIPKILDTINDDISDGIQKNIRNDIIDHVGDNINELKEMCKNKNPNDWNTDEIINANNLMNSINNYYDVLNDLNDYLKSDAINIEDIINNNIKDVIENYLPTHDKVKDDIIDVLKDVFNDLCNYIKDICKQNIVLTDNIEDNEFDRNLDLTKIYRIPGVKSSKCLCIPTADDKDSLWCDPEVIGGTGCIYEYMLFLKEKFYLPILPILVNDSIQTVGVSLNPILDNLKDTLYIFHDVEIINDYNKLIDSIYKGEEIDVSNNKYIQRIDLFMDSCEAWGFTVIVNLMDFTYQKYMWLQNIPDMDKYTHDMIDEKFIQYMSLIVNHIYYNLKNNKRRLCRIILNLGNGSFVNPADIDNEKFSIYPNCGFMRELIMKLVYKCKISSNYMSVTANEDNNLYYYNPYSEFKCYDDAKEHKLLDYDICIRDSVDNKTNGNDDVIIYDDENNIKSGYAKFYTSCSDKSYPMSYIYDLMEWANKYDGLKTILEKYTMLSGEIDSNIMNVIFTPHARKVMRYFFKGHIKYFKYKDLEFDPNTGMPLEE